MKNSERMQESAALVDAVLADRDWGFLQSRVRREAVAALAMATHRRAQVRRTMLSSMVVLLAACAGWLSSVLRKQPLPVASPGGLSRATEQRFVSEKEMLAMFPSHSCVIAEVDGEKQLVFFDAKKAKEGFEVSER